jgi:hypothetical protein
MSFLGEQLAEEWLNRKGYFTIRGAKVGNGEIDLLAVRFQEAQVECCHYEVQSSLRPVSYICPTPKSLRQEGKSAYNAKRRPLDEIKKSVSEWVNKKFNNDAISKARKKLWPGKWRLGFIVGNVKHPEELDFIGKSGIEIIRIANIIKDLSPKWSDATGKFILGAASGADLVDLVYAQKQLGLL